MIRFDQVTKYFGERRVLDAVTFEVARGETFVIVGFSGAGKSVTLKHMIRLLTPDAGRVWVDGEAISEAAGRALARLRQRFGVLFQGAALLEWLTVFENVALPLREKTALGEDAITQRVRETLRQVNLDGIQDAMPAELSGGMRKRVGLARAIVERPDIILYDEPTSGLDPVTSRAIDQLIDRMRRDLGVTSVVVTHDLFSALAIGTRIAMIYEGRILEVSTRGKGRVMPINKRREWTMEVMVGTFLFAVLLGLCAFTIVLSRENIFRATYPLEVVFEDVMGLRDGDNVVMRGMTVGKVKSMALQADGVRVLAALQRPVVLREGYQAEIVYSSVLGGRYLQIAEGPPGAAPIAPDTPLNGNRPRDVIALVSDVTADLKTITAGIAAGEGTLGKLVRDDALYTDARDVVGDVKAAVRERGLLRHLETTASNLDAIVAKINRGEGTLGRLVNDDSLYLDARQLIGDIRATLDDVRETSPIVTFSSIFFGAF